MADGVELAAVPAPCWQRWWLRPDACKTWLLMAMPGRVSHVDYAHTPDALAKALETVRETRPAAMAVVFGCGGNRDRSKRPQMGRIAADRADRVYVTSDNPRNEDPDAIVADIPDGIPTPARRARWRSLIAATPSSGLSPAQRSATPY